MQLGIIEVVDRIALTLVGRRPELDQELARSLGVRLHRRGDARQLIEFYGSDTGKKFADLQPQLLAVEMAAAQEWGALRRRRADQKVAGGAAGRHGGRAAGAAGRRSPARRRRRPRRRNSARWRYDYDLFVIGAGLGRRPRRPQGGGGRRARRHRRERPGRRHLRHPRLRAEEAARLRLAVPRSLRGQRRPTAGRSAPPTSTGRR